MFQVETIYQRPDIEATRQQVNILERDLQSAANEDEFFAALSRWNDLRVKLSTQETAAGVMSRQDTQNKAEQEFFHKATPEFKELNQRRTQALLKSPFQAAYAARYGEHLLARERCEAASFHPSLKPLLVQESQLKSRYLQILSRPEIELRGQTMNINGLEPLFQQADRELRREAQQAREVFLQKHQEELDALFSSLVSLRDQMGKALGHASFTPLGYQLRKRTTYGPEEVAAFRSEIEQEIIPLVHQVAKDRAERLGVAPLLFHDESVFDSAGNPKPLGDASFCIKQAREMFRQLGPRFEAFYEMMTSRGLMDLADRPNKAYGAYAVAFLTEKLPFISANFNGSQHDVRVFVHECGHAFHGSQQLNAPLLEACLTTTDASEVHSISLENLAHPAMHLFFGDDAPRYIRLHMEHQLLFIAYACVVDAFEHEVYQNPTMTPKERRQLWRELEQRYQPYRDYGGLFPHMESGVFWHRQGHVYLYPFYYLDYILANTCALQLWQRAAKNREEAMEDYLRICAPGGSKDFTTMLKNGRFVSPFTKGCLREVVRGVEDSLQNHR